MLFGKHISQAVTESNLTGCRALYQLIWFLTSIARKQAMNNHQCLKQCKMWHSVWHCVWQWRRQPSQCTAPHTVLLSGEWVCGCLCYCHWCRPDALHTQWVSQKLWAHGVQWFQHTGVNSSQLLSQRASDAGWWESHMLCGTHKKQKEACNHLSGFEREISHLKNSTIVGSCFHLVS